MPRPRSWLSLIACCVPLAAFLVVYAPVVGLGFISDDFRWIAISRIAAPGDLGRVFASNTGFYRPLVSLTFALDYALFDLRPLGYGVTNLLLALLCAALIARLFARVGLPAAAAALGAAIWLLNFHGINMALLWISGRTALVLIVFTVSAAICWLSGRWVWTLVFVALAVLSKEEAVALPPLLLAWGLVVGRMREPDGRRQMLGLAAGSAAVLTFYLVLRTHAGAFSPAAAPSYYRFTASPDVVARNIAEYFDRACTFTIGVALVARVAAGRLAGRVAVERRLVALAVVWYACAYALTTFLPGRSSLYACLPSIAAAMLSAAFCAAVWRSASPAGRRRCLAAAILVPVLCVPIYAARNRRWTELALFSSSVLYDLRPYVTRVPPDAWLVLRDDDREKRVNVQSAFGSLLPDALALTAGRAVNVWVEPPLATGNVGVTPPCADCNRTTLRVAGGRVTVY